jgi:hypothetical protein
MKLMTWKSDDMKKLREQYTHGKPMTQEDLDLIHYNRTNNPDIRVKETMRTLAIALENQPGKDGHADRLITEKTFHELTRMLAEKPGPETKTANFYLET